MAGLDPAIHRKKRWMLGSRPSMTGGGGRASARKRWRLARLRRDDAAGVFLLELGDVVAGERDCILPLGELDLEDHLVHVPERNLAAGEIEIPHAAEAGVVERFGLFPVGVEAPAPFAQGRGVVQAQD